MKIELRQHNFGPIRLVIHFVPKANLKTSLEAPVQNVDVYLVAPVVTTLCFDNCLLLLHAHVL